MNAPSYPGNLGVKFVGNPEITRVTAACEKHTTDSGTYTVHCTVCQSYAPVPCTCRLANGKVAVPPLILEALDVLFGHKMLCCPHGQINSQTC